MISNSPVMPKALRWLFAISFVVVPVLNCGAQGQWKRVAIYRFDWAGPGQTATAILELPAQHADPGNFTRLRVRVPGHPEFVLFDKDGLVNFRKENCSFHFEFCKRKNLIASNYLLLLPVEGGNPVLFVFGYAYASSPGSLHAIAFGTDGSPREIFSAKEFDLYDFSDVNSDGMPEIVGKKCLSETLGDSKQTYDPYSVFRLPKAPATKAVYSLLLSKTYNLKHYYGWAGPNCREDVLVVLHPPGGKKPMILPSKEAEKLFTKPSPKK